MLASTGTWQVIHLSVIHLPVIHLSVIHLPVIHLPVIHRQFRTDQSTRLCNILHISNYVQNIAHFTIL